MSDFVPQTEMAWINAGRWMNIHAAMQVRRASLYDEVRIDHAVFFLSCVVCNFFTIKVVVVNRIILKSKRGWKKKEREEWSNSILFQANELLMFRNIMTFIVINVQFSNRKTAFSWRDTKLNGGKMPRNGNKAKMRHFLTMMFMLNDGFN